LGGQLIKRSLFCEDMRFLIVIIILIVPNFTFATDKANMVLVIKSESKLFLKKDDKILKEYHVVFGANPKGHKLQESDERTPEGKYILDYKKKNSSFYKAIHISYPNENDKQRAKKSGVNPGGFIMIHGQKNKFGWVSWISQRFNWTDGCIAVSNSEMDEIWKAVDTGTPIEITP
jgi:murein L,D-transpeptidase YafK